MSRYPDGKRFAFTIIDDTDVATVANVAPIYRLLEQLGFRTTKTVWPLDCPEGSRDFDSSQTLVDAEYREFVIDLQRRGFEIASHGATMESSDRSRTLRGFETMRETFGRYPSVHANHANNMENLYWGTERVDDPFVRAAYRLAARERTVYKGHLEGTPYSWGDFATTHLEYVRNLTFDALDVSSINPTMPYRDARRPKVKWWFSAADADNRGEFNRLLRDEAQQELERNGGIAIVATHFGKGFVTDGRVNDTTAGLLERLSRRPGWFVPVGELLDWLRKSGAAGPLPADEWRRMQWRWLRDLLARGVRDRLLPRLRQRIA